MELRVMQTAKPEWERRGNGRLEIVRPCKIYVPRMEKYLHGMTWNISEGGVLVQLSRPITLEHGQPVYVGIATKRRDVLLKVSEMIQAEVLRSLKTPSDSTAVALRFTRDVDVQMPLLLREAA
jgi:c-di-GMP-binding flagellar brake protein YcgR